MRDVIYGRPLIRLSLHSIKCAASRQIHGSQLLHSPYSNSSLSFQYRQTKPQPNYITSLFLAFLYLVFLSSFLRPSITLLSIPSPLRICPIQFLFLFLIKFNSLSLFADSPQDFFICYPFCIANFLHPAPQFTSPSLPVSLFHLFLTVIFLNHAISQYTLASLLIVS